MSCTLRALLAAAVCGLAACHDPATTGAPDATVSPFTGDAAAPPLFDAGAPNQLPEFDGGPPIAPNPAFNPLSPPDAGETSDARMPAPAPDCLSIEPGETVVFEDRLTDDKRWHRIEAVEACPAMVVTAKQVAYRPYVLCPSERARTLEVVMRGADMLPMPPRESVADTFLAVYAQEARAMIDPFDCLAANDDAMFGGFLANSARIDELTLGPGSPAVIFASSAERPEQRGVGLFELEIHAN